MDSQSILTLVGHTPLVRLKRLVSSGSVEVWVKLEGQNPAGSVKDRAARSMVYRAIETGVLKTGDTVIEATSGNTGIALAMVCAIIGLHLKLVMPENQSKERRAAMQAYGAHLILVPDAQGMEGARDLALQMAHSGQGKILDQFNNPDNPRAHYESTGPELWQQTHGRMTHFVSAMGTTGTIMGVSRYLREKNSGVQILGLQPAAGSQIPGIRRWPPAYMPGIFQPELVDEIIDVRSEDAIETMRQLALTEGIFCGVSSGGAVYAALQKARTLQTGVIVAIICDRGDRYLSTGVFNAAVP